MGQEALASLTTGTLAAWSVRPLWRPRCPTPSVSGPCASWPATGNSDPGDPEHSGMLRCPWCRPEQGACASGADPGTRGLFLGLRLRRRGAEDGAGQSQGNRLDDVTRAGGRRVPQGRESRGRLEHLGICSPGGPGRSQAHCHLESGAIHFTDGKSEDQKIEGALGGEMHRSPHPHSPWVQGKSSLVVPHAS